MTRHGRGVDPAADHRRLVPVRTAVEDRLFAALGVLRVILLVNALAMNWVRSANFVDPAVGLVAMLAMIVWTAVATSAYSRAARRTWTWLAADLVVTVAAMLASVPAKGEELRATVPGFWVMGVMLAWAIHWGWRGGLAAAVVLVVVDASMREVITQSNYGNIFLLLIGGPIVGFVSDSLKQMAAERDRAERESAAAAERARLARAVHDGVLQVLALVQRTARDLPSAGREDREPKRDPVSEPAPGVGDEFTKHAHFAQWRRLGILAGEQESALRALIRQQDSMPTMAARESLGDVDLMLLLERLEAAAEPIVALSGPASAVMVEAGVAGELVAAVAECLVNVASHVGPQTRAWVLVEEAAGSVVVSVRDDGPGIAPGRLESAAAEGRLGVSNSIVGRLEAMGGSATLTTGAGGTEWELIVPHHSKGRKVGS